MTPRPPASGNPLLAELKAVHSMLRRDLRSVRTLASEVAAGASPAQVAQSLRSMQSRGPLWQLKINCLTYCSFVHGHHGHEDTALFPSLRRADPALRPVIDRLMADHVKVSDLLDEVEAATRFVHDNPEGRTRLIAGLTALSEVLLAHLDYEEKALGPALARWQTWPGRH